MLKAQGQTKSILLFMTFKKGKKKAVKNNFFFRTCSLIFFFTVSKASCKTLLCDDFNRKSFTTLLGIDSKEPAWLWKLLKAAFIDRSWQPPRPRKNEVGQSSPQIQRYLPTVRVNVLSGHLGTWSEKTVFWLKGYHEPTPGKGVLSPSSKNMFP